MFMLYQAHLGPQIWLNVLGIKWIKLIVYNDLISRDN